MVMDGCIIWKEGVKRERGVWGVMGNERHYECQTGRGKGGWKDKRKRYFRARMSGQPMLQYVCKNSLSVFLFLSSHNMIGTLHCSVMRPAERHADLMAPLWCACECMCCCVIASQVASRAKCPWRPLSVFFFFFLQLCPSRSVSLSLTLPSLLSLCRPFCRLDHGCNNVFEWRDLLTLGGLLLLASGVTWNSTCGSVCLHVSISVINVSVSSDIHRGKSTLSCVCNWSLTSQTSWKHPLPLSPP